MKSAGAILLAVMAAGCQAGMAGNPQASALNLELGAAYLSQGRLELALEKLIRAAQQDPRSPEAHRVLGIVYERMEDAASAEDHYRLAVRLAPKDVEALNSLGVLRCREDGDARQGLKLLERAAREASEERRAEIYANCGFCELPRDPAIAAQWFRRALKLDPRHRQARLFLDRLEAHN